MRKIFIALFIWSLSSCISEADREHSIVLEVDFSDSTRSNFGIAGKSKFDFVIRAFDKNGEAVQKPSKLMIDGEEVGSWEQIQIFKTGTVKIWAEMGDTQSEALVITLKDPFAGNTTTLPVIFHVVHTDEPRGSVKNPATQAIYKELENANLRLQNKIPTRFPKSMSADDAKVEFVLAATDPFGKPLAEAGIHRIKTEFEDFDFITDPTRDFLMANLWDPNQFVNVFVMDIKSDFSFAYLPALRDQSRPNDMAGTLNYPYSAVVNIEALDSHILAHELGHMLGLSHPFASEEDIVCTNLDQIEDTQDYLNTPENLNGAFRINCSGDRFFSTNIMDHNFGAKNSFTLGQVERMNFVLENAFFLPTAKNNLRISPWVRGEHDPSILPVR